MSELVRDVEDRDLDAIPATAQAARIGRADTVTVQFRGVCSACRSGAVRESEREDPTP